MKPAALTTVQAGSHGLAGFRAAFQIGDARERETLLTLAIELIAKLSTSQLARGERA